MDPITFPVHDYQMLRGPRLQALSDALGIRLSAAILCRDKAGSLIVAAVSPGEDVPPNRNQGSGGIIFVPPHQLPWYLDLLRNEGLNFAHLEFEDTRLHFLTTTREQVGEAEAAAQPGPAPPSLRDWLDLRPNVRNALRWDGESYQDWSEHLRDQFDALFEKAMAHQPLPETVEPPPNVAVTPAIQYLIPQVIGDEDAWTLYSGFAAHSLALEIGRKVPWSIAAWPEPWLRDLLDSHQMFEGQPDGFGIDPHVHGEVTPCNMAVAWNFLVENRLLGGTQLGTVGRILDWCRDNLSHFTGAGEVSDFERDWHYSGLPPVSRMIGGTSGLDGFLHYTSGCMGTCGFLKVILRAANIPVRSRRRPVGGPLVRAHTLVEFPSIDRFLTHGDDPYSRHVRTALPLFSSEELLISGQRFEQLFGAGVSEADQARNIGIRTQELALIHPSLEMLRNYCDDMAQALDHASGSVFASLNDLQMGVEQLEAAGLWAMLDEALEQIGGCGPLDEFRT